MEKFNSELDFHKFIVESIKPYTKKWLNRKQIGQSVVKCDYNEHKHPYYVYQGINHKIYNGTVYIVSGLPILSSTKSFNKTLQDAIRDGDIFKQILVFVNNKHIDPETIRVIHSNSTYLYIENEDDCNDISFYELNFSVDFHRDYYSGNNDFISFNLNGNLSKYPTVGCISYIVKNGEDITVNCIGIDYGENKSLISSNYVAYRENLILFNESGELDDEYNSRVTVTNFNTLRSTKFKGNGLFIFSKKDHNNSEKSTHNNTFDNVELWERYLIYNDLVEGYKESLEFISNEQDTEEYYKECLTLILKYHFNLFVEAFDKYFKWKDDYYISGAEINKLNGLNIYDNYKYNLDCGLLLFIDGILQSKSNKNNYNKDLNSIKFKNLNVYHNDEICLSYYKDIENRNFRFDLIEGKEILIDPSFDISKAKMYTNYIHDHAYGFMSNDKTLYEIEFKYSKIREGVYRIDPIDSRYYGATVELHSTQQFRHFSYKVNGDRYRVTFLKIQLPNEFNTCRNLDQYQIYINGKLLVNTRAKHWLTYPSKTTPYKTTMYYCNHKVQENDIIDVIYLPKHHKIVYTGECGEVVNLEDKPSYSVFRTNKSILPYPLDNKLYTYYLNGKLLNSKYIKTISSNTLKVELPYSVAYNDRYYLTIVELYDGKESEFISNLFKDNYDIITNITNDMDNDMIRYLLGYKNDILSIDEIKG